MYNDAIDLRDFYASSLGAMVRRILRARLRETWPDLFAKAVANGIALHGKQGSLPFAVHGNGKTYGEIYEIDAAMLAALDHFEGHPQWYVREMILVELCDGRRVHAWIYLNQDAYLYPKVPDGEWKLL